MQFQFLVVAALSALAVAAPTEVAEIAERQACTAACTDVRRSLHTNDKSN